jgi:hypothetical protein
MSISLTSIRDHLLPGLFQITGKYNEVPPDWHGLFKIHKSNLALERSVQDRFMGVAKLKTEGGATTFDNDAGQRWVYNMEPIEVGLGYSITRKAIDDNVYKDAFQPTNLNLQLAFKTFWQIQAASIFNNATTYISALGGDGQALLSTTHPVDTGTFANTTTTQLDLNEASLLTGMKAVRKNFVDEAGILVDAHAEQLVIPVDLIDTGIRLLHSDLRPGTGNNDTNAIRTMFGGIGKGYKEMRYFTSSFQWFLKTNIEGLIYLDRIPFEMDMHVEFITDNLLVKGYERGGMFYNDPRCVWGQIPTA